MKKFLISLGLAALVGTGVLAATVTNRIGQVIVVSSDGVVTSVTDPNGPQPGTNSITGLVGIQLNGKTYSPADAAGALSDATPRAVGDLLLYVRAVSNRLWIANTTTNWIDLD